MQPSNKSDLPHGQVELVELMQRLAFGYIEELVVRDGLPVLEPRTRVIRDVKFGAVNDPRPEAKLSDFVLKACIHELMDVFACRGNTTVRCLEFRYGLPFRMQLEEETG